MAEYHASGGVQAKLDLNRRTNPSAEYGNRTVNKLIHAAIPPPLAHELHTAGLARRLLSPLASLIHAQPGRNLCMVYALNRCAQNDVVDGVEPVTGRAQEID